MIRNNKTCFKSDLKRDLLFEPLELKKLEQRNDKTIFLIRCEAIFNMFPSFVKPFFSQFEWYEQQISIQIRF